VAANPHNSIALQRVINSPRRGIGNKSIEALAAHANRNGISMYEAMRQVCGGAEIDLPKGSIPKFTKLRSQIDKWQQFGKNNPPSVLLEHILEDTGYIESLGDPNNLEVISRKDNIEELRTSIIQQEE